MDFGALLEWSLTWLQQSRKNFVPTSVELIYKHKAKNIKQEVRLKDMYIKEDLKYWRGLPYERYKVEIHPRSLWKSPAKFMDH